MDEEDEVTDNGFDTVLSVLRSGDFNHIQAIQLIQRANQLAGDDMHRLLQLRRTLIWIFGTRIGDNTRVVLQFLNENHESVVLFV